MNIKKITLVTFSIALAFLLPFGILFTIKGEKQAYADSSEYEYIQDWEDLYEIRNDSTKLVFVKGVGILDFTETKTEEQIYKITESIKTLAQCPNLENLYVNVANYTFKMALLNNCISSKLNQISFSCMGNYNMTVDFEGVSQINFPQLSIFYCDLLNFDKVINFQSLESLTVAHVVKGFEVIDFSKLPNLKDLTIEAVPISNYSDFCYKARNVKKLDIRLGNLKNNDTQYLSYINNLEVLHINGTYVDDIGFLENFHNLKEVWLPFYVQSLDVLYNMTNLQIVEINGHAQTKVDNNLVDFLIENHMVYDFSYDYYRQMAEISTKVNQILSSLNFTSDTTEFEKIEKIVHYIVTHVSYGARVNHTILEGVGICDDYALLTHILLKEAGIDVYYVGGNVWLDGKPLGDMIGHAWNVVRVHNDWYGLDCTWIDDASLTDASLDEWKESTRWKSYFLSNPIRTDDNWPSSDDPNYTHKIFPYEHRTVIKPYETSSVHDSRIIKNVSLTSNPKKTTYEQNSLLDLTGAVLTINYNDGTKNRMSLPNPYVSYSGFDSSVSGAQMVTLTYHNKTTTFTVNVAGNSGQTDPEPQTILSYIYISQNPTKTTYIQNQESLDLTGGMIMLVYVTGGNVTYESLSMLDSRVTTSGFNNSSVGANTVYVYFLGKSTSFQVQILEDSSQAGAGVVNNGDNLDDEDDESNRISSNWETIAITVGCIFALFLLMKIIRGKRKNKER